MCLNPTTGSYFFVLFIYNPFLINLKASFINSDMKLITNKLLQTVRPINYINYIP